MPDPKKLGKRPKDASTDHAPPSGSPQGSSSLHRISVSALLNAAESSPDTAGGPSAASSTHQGVASTASSTIATATMRCPACRKAFTDHFELYRHIRSHKVTCRECGLRFSRSAYAAHKKMHMTGRPLPHQCRYCSASFIDKQSLREHERGHKRTVR